MVEPSPEHHPPGHGLAAADPATQASCPASPTSAPEKGHDVDIGTARLINQKTIAEPNPYFDATKRNSASSALSPLTRPFDLSLGGMR
jgi:hypothetical protein